MINCPGEVKRLFVQVASADMAALAGDAGLGLGLGVKKGKGKGKTIQARHADFFLSSKMEQKRRKDGAKYVHLVLCQVQCGRVYEVRTHYHSRKLEDRLEDGFDSAYDRESACYRLSQANLQLALPVFILEVLVKPRLDLAAPPSYWTSDASPFALVPTTSAESNALQAALSPGGSLGGRDRREGGNYSTFRFQLAWRLEHPGLWGKYAAERQNMRNQLAHLKKARL